MNSLTYLDSSEEAEATAGEHLASKNDSSQDSRAVSDPHKGLLLPIFVQEALSEVGAAGHGIRYRRLLVWVMPRAARVILRIFRRLLPVFVAQTRHFW